MEPEQRPIKATKQHTICMEPVLTPCMDKYTSTSHEQAHNHSALDLYTVPDTQLLRFRSGRHFMLTRARLQGQIGWG